MKTLIKPVVFNEESYNVVLLQKTLEVLGFSVSQDEVKQHKAGDDTRIKTRDLQSQLNVPVDDSILVNESTIEAISKALTRIGLTETSQSFTVSGSARMQDGAVKKFQHLLAFDLDLRGVGIYRDVKTTAEINASGGFEFLGQTSTDNRGNYEITFYEWQYRRAERKKADVVVYAVEEREGGIYIIGHSRLVNSEDYSDKGLVRDLDIIVTETDSRTEYEKVMGALKPFLEESATNLAEISTSSEQLGFTASELDIELAHLNIAADAELLGQGAEEGLSHELLYGIGRQDIRLTWPVLYRKSEDELYSAIKKSIEARIVHAFEEEEIAAFLEDLRTRSVIAVLHAPHGDAGGNTLNAMLSNALPEKAQRLSFLNAIATFSGRDYRDFWNNHLPSQPEFSNNPELVSNLLLTQQLTRLTGNHQALVNDLQVQKQLNSIDQLFDLEKNEWIEIIQATGVPEFIQGQNDEEKIRGYAEAIQDLLNATFPTRRILRMVETDELPIDKNVVSRGIKTFLRMNPDFDFAESRIHEFKEEIKAVAGKNLDEVREELKKIQRIFQISTTPEAMRVLMENNLHSAYTIANIPRKSFIKTYGNILGGELNAIAIHERASHISTRAEMAAMHIMEYSHSATPQYAMGKTEYDAAIDTIKKHLPNPTPNFDNLFGTPDICECEHCRSAYSPAAYFIDLLRFLWRCEPNAKSKTPLDLLTKRRPDLLHLPLTCENTNTLIPYIDLANEVMEFYTANDGIATFQGYDTGEATVEELRANPQNFNVKAYSKLKDAKYPFTLPYHQPLDVIRTYSDHLKVSRFDVLKAINPQPNQTTRNAIAAESLRISEEEYKILTGKDFNGHADATALYKYFGYQNAGDLENMSAVREFLHRSGITYTDLVELVNTQFINPYQRTLDFLQKIFAYALAEANTIYTIYTKLVQIEAGTLDPAKDADIVGALTKFNQAQGKNITSNELAQWVTSHLAEFCQVITLYEADSKCDLGKTKLRSIINIYTNPATSGISGNTWSKVHRFIRLWQKLGWTIHETDVVLGALGEKEITDGTITKLESISLLLAITKLSPSQLAVVWGNIDTYGKESLYRKLFLNKAVQQIDAAFKADAWGNYLEKGTEVLVDRQSAILAAFQIREDDLAAILSTARVDDGANPPNLRLIDIKTDKLNIANLSTIYRYVVLAKALKMRIGELCKLIDLFQVSPFSIWNLQQKQFTNIEPEKTLKFYQLAESVQKAGFKTEILDYIFNGKLPVDAKTGFDTSGVLQAAKSIRDTFSAIEQNHPQTAPSPITKEILTAKLAMTFQPEIVTRFMGILDGTASFAIVTDANLDVAIPDALSPKYSYVKGSGRLTCNGVMSDAEKMELKGLKNANAKFKDAIDALYAAPKKFIDENLVGIFINLGEAKEKLLDRPAQGKNAATLEERLAYVYDRFVPILKRNLRRDAITKHVAALIELSEEATSLLIAQDKYFDALIADIAKEGFSATYFSDATWTASVLPRTDTTVDFVWGKTAPDPAVPANNFSVRWEAYIVAPASGEYTLRVDVAEADEIFKLYLDDKLILEKTAADAQITWEYVASLNSAQMHLLKLEYAEQTQNAGVRLQWLTTMTAPEVIPASAAYPAAILDAFAAKVTVYHRAGKFISGFGLSETELNHLLKFSPDFGNIDFYALTANHWQRVSDYTTLRNAVPQAQALLTDVFVAGSQRDSLSNIDDPLKALLYQATAWDKSSLGYLIDHFGLKVGDLKNEKALNRLQEVMQIVTKTGLSAQTITAWGKADAGFDELNTTAQLIKNTVRAKYQEKDWLQLAGNLSDTIRKNQQQSLISYLLTRSEIKDWGAQDADGLFEYFLIDVQMGSCMDTSRIVQATAAIQMFVNRCLLNLESNKTSNGNEAVSPEAIDKDRWEWMKNYRVWEVNRKVFLYPENWLEPEWRNNRSEFFKELESYLVQNDITDRSVEQAFRNYLTSLNEVANLDVCGMYQENDDNEKLKYLHVFARSNNAPYKFFYRRWDKYQKWSAWERVAVDIRSIEDGENSGVHLIPVVWKKRLFLFWPEFTPVKKENPGNDTMSAEQLGGKSIATLKAEEYWEIRLAWSEYVDGKWSPKQLTKEIMRADASGDYQNIARYTWHVNTAGLTLSLHDKYDLPYKFRIMGTITIKDVQSKADVVDKYPPSTTVKVVAPPSGVTYINHFMKHTRNSPLELGDSTYLNRMVNHNLLYSSDELYAQSSNGQTVLRNPFFFGDWYRTYFVRPVDIPILVGLKSPSYVMPSLPGLVIDTVSLNDYMPVNVIAAEGAGRLPAKEFRMNSDRSLSERSASARSGNTEVRMAPTMMMSSANTSMLERYNIEIANTENAFGGIMKAINSKWIESNITFLEFHTFYHPSLGKYVENLNNGGISRGNKPSSFPPGLMESDTEIPSDEGDTFKGAYDPNLNFVLEKPADFLTRTYYKENVCFDPKGANSLYNWELFFHAPLYIATRLSKNGKYEEAMKWFHYIFDPTTDEIPSAGQSEISRYWKVLPFKTEPAKSLEDWFRTLSPNKDPNTENKDIGEWRDHPFDAHLVASNRPLAYMKHVVIKYVENLIAWGDSLFRQFSRESVNEALQIYVIANHILGPRPEFVPKRGEIDAKSYDNLKDKWDDFSNALVELENIFPYSSNVNVGSASTGTNLLGLGSALYFCIPPNEKLLEYWNTVSDRLDKIRHCKDIDGVERRLALFSPPIEPSLLIQAVSQGLSLGSILSDLSSPPPNYRFTHLIQKANEFCSDVKALGSALLAALEKKDAEELGRLRASHETQMLELMTAVRERQILDAKENKENLEKARATACYRLQHYIALLGNSSVTVPDTPEISAELTSQSQLPADTNIVPIQTDVDESLVDSDERGVKLIPKEKEDLKKALDSITSQIIATGNEALASVLNIIPTFSGFASPFGVGVTTSFGGSNLGAMASALAKVPQIWGQIDSHQAAQAAKTASFIRREQDWTLQANLAVKEIIQLDKQITSSDIRIQVAEKELENHKRQIDKSKEVELFLKDKFTNLELYQWMKEQLFAVYKQSYNLAFDMAKKAEKAYKFEMGTELASFIQYGYWDNSKQGLVAGEKLQLALRQMEKSYLENNRRELELTKSISLAHLNPLALIELRETGKCYVSVPEELFDLDFPGHYFRRIKAVRLSIPCVAGPYTSVSCTLRLLNNTVRINTALGTQYEHNNEEDDRFRTNYTPVTAIATSSAQNDSGTFDFNFRDERYLPFELAGAIGEWQLELSTDKELRPFDYSTISDVILHLNYTARESGGTFKDKATDRIHRYLKNVSNLVEQPLLMQMFSAKHEFPTNWSRFLNAYQIEKVAGQDQLNQTLELDLTQEHFPFLFRGETVTSVQVDLFLKFKDLFNTDVYKTGGNLTFFLTPPGGQESSHSLESNSFFLQGIPHAVVPVSNNISGTWVLKLKEEDIKKIAKSLQGSVKVDGKEHLRLKADAIEDILILFHYSVH